MRDTDVHICVPHDLPARILEVHHLVLHCICDGVDAQLLGLPEALVQRVLFPGFELREVVVRSEEAFHEHVILLWIGIGICAAAFFISPALGVILIALGLLLALGLLFLTVWFTIKSIIGLINLLGDKAP